MPIYSLQCKVCGDLSEHIMGMETNHDTEIKCPSCSSPMTRWSNRAYWADNIQIQGDTVAGGCNYDYYDENLGVHIRSKQHRKAEMERQGLQEYSPDKDIQKIRDEKAYVRRHTSSTDREARATLSTLTKQAQKTRQRKQIEKTFENAPLPNINID